MLRGTATARGGLFRITPPPANAVANHITLQRWLGIAHRTWEPTPSLGQRIRPIGRIVQISTQDFSDRGHRRVIVFLPHPHQVGTILTHFMDTYQITAPPCLHWTDAIAAHLDPARHWRIYADGTWHPHTPPHTDHYFHTGDTHTGGGCLVIMATDEHWAHGPILAIPFSAAGLSTDQGGSPALMELLAITGGLQALAHLRLSGTVLSDCQGLVRKLAHRHVLRRNPTSARYPLMRDCARSITPARTLQWIKGHPERTRTPRSGWTQDQWGNYLADLYARSPASSPPLDFPSLVILPPLSYTAFAQAAIRPQDWHFVAPDQAPLLTGLGSALAHASLVDYLHTRDASRAARWASTSVTLAAKAWQLSQRGIARR